LRRLELWLAFLNFGLWVDRRLFFVLLACGLYLLFLRCDTEAPGRSLRSLEHVRQSRFQLAQQGCDFPPSILIVIGRVRRRCNLGARLGDCLGHIELRVKPRKTVACVAGREKALEPRDGVQQQLRIRCAMPASIFLQEPASLRALCNYGMERLVVLLGDGR
jgi:hypothetical protein